MNSSFSWLNIFLILIGGYGLLAAYLYFSQNSQVYHPPKGHIQTPKEWGMEYDTVLLKSAGHTLTNWWIPGRDENPVVLFFHGNASNISEAYDHVKLFHSLGMGVFLLEYRGYGLSEGHPSEEGTQADAEAAWQFLRDKKNIPVSRIIFYGHSLGGGVATGLAVKHPPAKLVIEGTFTSVPDVAAEIYPYLPVRMMAHIKYPNLKNIKQIKVPVLIIHSIDDDIIPFTHGEKLFAAANEPKTFYKSSGSHHSGFSTAGSDSAQVLKKFIFQ
ncbi:MAG: alpha/beta fold hydrolase [Magnetococcales bacterium]|nr:alpha/beta fold hydrolase [Magnetococcales bacterium]